MGFVAPCQEERVLPFEHGAAPEELRIFANPNWNSVVGAEFKKMNPWSVYEKEYFDEIYVPPDPKNADEIGLDKRHKFLLSSEEIQQSLLSMGVPTPLAPPKKAEDVDVMFSTCILLWKYGSLVKARNAADQVQCSLFASGIVEKTLLSLPHPVNPEIGGAVVGHPSGGQDTMGLVSLRYRMREIFLGYRPSKEILSPNACHGGVDPTQFLGALEFFIKTLQQAKFQVAQTLALAQIHRHVAVDVCRSLEKAVYGKLLLARSLLLLDELGHCFFELRNCFTEQDLPLFPVNIAHETIDRSAARNQSFARNAVAMSLTTAEKYDKEFILFDTAQSPYSEHNAKAVVKLQTWHSDRLNVDYKKGMVSAKEAAANGFEDEHNAILRSFGSDLNMFWFHFLRAEFLVKLASYKCMPWPSSSAAVVVDEGFVKSFIHETNAATVINSVKNHNETVLKGYLENQPKFLAKASEILGQIWKQMVTCLLSKDVSDPEQFPVDLEGLLHKHVVPAEVRKVVREGNNGEQAEILAGFRDFISASGLEILLEIRLLWARIYELKGVLKDAVSEILYGQLLMSKLSIPVKSVEQAEAEQRANPLQPQQAYIAMRRSCDMKTWLVLRVRLAALLEKQGRMKACQTHVERGIEEADKSRDSIAKIELLFVRAKSYLTEGRLLEVISPTKGNEGCVPDLLNLLKIASDYFPRELAATTLVRAKLMLHAVLLQNPGLNHPKFLFAIKPGPPKRNLEVRIAEVIKQYAAEGEEDDSDDFKAIALANAQKNISPIATLISGKAVETASGPVGGKQKNKSASSASTSAPSSSSSSSGGEEQAGGSSSSSAAPTPFVSERDDKRNDFLVLLLEESRRDLDYLLKKQDAQLHPRDLNHLSHYADKPANEDEIKKRVFLNLLPVSEHAFAWSGELQRNDGRGFANIYLILIRLRAILQLELADLKLKLVGTTRDLLSADAPKNLTEKHSAARSFLARHGANGVVRYLLEAGHELRSVELSFKQMLFLPTRYFVHFAQLKLKWRRLAVLEGRVPRPFFESLDVLVHYYLRDGISPHVLEPIYRSYVQRNRPVGLASPDYRWWLDRKPERLEVFVKEAQCVLTLAISEGGHEERRIFAILHEVILETLKAWTDFVAELPKCARLVGKRVALGEPVVGEDEDFLFSADADAGGKPQTTIDESFLLLRKYKNHFSALVYVCLSTMHELCQKKLTLERRLAEIAKASPDGASGVKTLLTISEPEAIACGAQLINDLFLHVLRQKEESALQADFGAAATADDAPQPPTALAALQYLLSLRKESAAVQNLDEELVFLTDAVHLLLSKQIPSYEQKALLPAASVEKLSKAVPILDTAEIMRRDYSFDPVTLDADEAARPKAEDLTPIILDSVGLQQNEGQIFFFYDGQQAPAGLSNPLAYPEDGQSLLVFLSDFNVVFRLPGHVRHCEVRQCYDAVAVLRKNATSKVLAGFKRDHVEKTLTEFALLLDDTRLAELEARGTDLSEKGEGWVVLRGRDGGGGCVFGGSAATFFPFPVRGGENEHNEVSCGRNEVLPTIPEIFGCFGVSGILVGVWVEVDARLEATLSGSSYRDEILWPAEPVTKTTRCLAGRDGDQDRRFPASSRPKDFQAFTRPDCCKAFRRPIMRSTLVVWCGELGQKRPRRAAPRCLHHRRCRASRSDQDGASATKTVGQSQWPKVLWFFHFVLPQPLSAPFHLLQPGYLRKILRP